MSWLDDILDDLTDIGSGGPGGGSFWEDLLDIGGDFLFNDDGSLDFETLLTVLGGAAGGLGWFDSDQPTVGYQGGIPEYTFVNSRVPDAVRNDRMPGSLGQRYFSDSIYAGGEGGPTVEEAREATNQQANQLRDANLGNASNLAPLLAILGHIRSRNQNTPGDPAPVDPPETPPVVPSEPPPVMADPTPPDSVPNDPPEPPPVTPPVVPPTTPPQTSPGGRTSPRTTNSYGPTTYGPTWDTVGTYTTPSPLGIQGTPRESAPNYTGLWADDGDYSDMSRLSHQQINDILDFGANAATADERRSIRQAAEAEQRRRFGSTPRANHGMNAQGFAGGGITTLPQYLRGPTDGMADGIATTIEGKMPAGLSHGEYVVPADVVSHLGNGNSEAGATQLDKMLENIRKSRTGSKRQAKQIDPAKHMPAMARG